MSSTVSYSQLTCPACARSTLHERRAAMGDRTSRVEVVTCVDPDHPLAEPRSHSC